MVEFTAKAWKQGNSLILTIPSNIKKDLGLSCGSEVNIDIKHDKCLVCKCGMVYGYGDKMDHGCYLVEFDVGVAFDVKELILGGKK